LGREFLLPAARAKGNPAKEESKTQETYQSATLGRRPVPPDDLSAV